MNLIAGLSTADQGSITVKGIPVSGYTSGFKQELGYCPQENVFYESLTVYENLKIASVLKGVSFGASMRKIRTLASKFDLLPKMSDGSKNLSGGMKRRLCLGMAIIGHKEVLVIGGFELSFWIQSFNLKPNQLSNSDSDRRNPST